MNSDNITLLHFWLPLQSGMILYKYKMLREISLHNFQILSSDDCASKWVHQ